VIPSGTYVNEISKSQGTDVHLGAARKGELLIPGLGLKQ
jgi:hypothetical protein